MADTLLGGETGGDPAGQAPPPAADPGTPTGFMSTLPEDIRGHEAFGRFKDSADGSDMAKHYLEIVGKVPAVPDSPDGYEVKVPEDMKINPERIAAFKQLAHKQGLTQDQVNAIVDENVATGQASAESRAAKIEEVRNKSINGLKDEWGPSYEENVDLARKAINAAGDKSFVDFLNNTRLGDNPTVIKFFHGLGKLISEDAFLKGKNSPPTTTQERGPGQSARLSFPNTPGMADK